MKSLWNNFKVAFAMFSKIPMPRADWTKENMKYMFCFFPFIGTVIGGLTMLVAYLGLRFGYQPGFVTAVLVLVPVFVTGGIHVDGLLDTSDALSSWQERSRRLMRWWKLYMGYLSFTNQQMPAVIFANNIFDRIAII